MLSGAAGTGKTTLLGALVNSNLKNDGILLLAPTGKASVRLFKKTGAEARTIASFLLSHNRYDTDRQTPIERAPQGSSKFQSAKTVIVDECSMLTLVDLRVLLDTLDLGFVTRVILVGDPNQLPPIGVGRPFADICAFLGTNEEEKLRGANATLTVEVRATNKERSDTLRLAAWFTDHMPPVDADTVFSELAAKGSLNDISISYWQDSEEIQEKIYAAFREHLEFDPDDIEAFNRAIGINPDIETLLQQATGIEKFQILSPVRGRIYGIDEINRRVQARYRRDQLRKGRSPFGVALGDQELVLFDKVIQNRNQWRNSYPGKQKEFVSNGEVGVIAKTWKPFANVVFADRKGKTFGYDGRWEFAGGRGPLELAYAITVHKAQGSEFEFIFLILPRVGYLSRELIYTALTRSRARVVVLLEGEPNKPWFLHELSSPTRSDTARRNTRLFPKYELVRLGQEDIPFNERLIHRTLRGEMVRSKSELVIANHLHGEFMEYQYERPLERNGDRKLPDFTFISPAGDEVVWEHLGLLHQADYADAWASKKKWYWAHGFREDQNLFWTADDKKGGLDSTAVAAVAAKVKAALSG